MERGILSVSPDPIPATHEFRCFEEQGKRRPRQGSIMTPEKSRDGMAGTRYCRRIDNLAIGLKLGVAM